MIKTHERPTPVADDIEKEHTPNETIEKLDSLIECARENPESEELKEAKDALSDVFAMLDEKRAGETASSRLLPIKLDALADAPSKLEESTTTSRLTDPEDPPAQPEKNPEPAPAKHERASLMRDVTFEKARKEKRELTDEFIKGAISNDLQKPGAKKAWSVKGYFDRVPPDHSDKEFVADHQQAIDFHEQLANFVGSELKFLAPPNFRSLLHDKRQQFIEKMKADNEKVRDYVKGWEDGLTTRENPLPRNALQFRGLTVQTTAMKNADLLEGGVADVRANLHVQREITGTFVHWFSEKYLQNRAGIGEREKLTHRIYLNPRPQDMIEVFTDLVHSVENAGEVSEAKIYDRTFDSEVMKSHESAKEPYDLRADGIVLYATDSNAEELLEIAKQVQQRHQSAFVDRQLPSMPFEIGDGIGIGDEPKKPGTSLSSHRAEVVDKVVRDVQASGETDPNKRLELFRRLWRNEALHEGINPDNLAFNS